MGARPSCNGQTWFWIAAIYIGGLATLGLASKGVGLWADSLTFTLLCVGLILAFTSATSAVILAVVVGLSCGSIRRVLDYAFPGGVLTSYWVLIPTVLIICSFIAAKYGNAIPTHRLPKFWIVAVIALVVAGLNPFGSGISTNLLASALLIVALLGFLLTRSRVVNFDAVASAVVLVGIINAMAILLQYAHGLTPWDEMWVATKGYAALYIGPDEVRPLGIASSAAESAALSGVVVVISAVRVRFGRPALRPIYAALTAISLWALLLCGTRSFLILAVAALCVLFVAGTSSPWWRLGLVLSAVVPLTSVVAGLLLPSIESQGAARSLTTLSGQEDMETSTIPIHWDLMVRGLLKGVTSIVGTGSGQLSVIGTSGGSAEIDLANLPLMAGLIGVVAVVMLYGAFTRSIRCLMRHRGEFVVGGLLLVATAGQWFAVGHYGMTPLLWLAFGQMHASVTSEGKNALGSYRQG